MLYMDAEIAELVAQIHATPPQAVIAVAGAGNYALAWLLGVGGASRTVLETRVPYGYRAMTDFLGGYAPEQTVAADTARRMARAAWQRGMALRENALPVIGIAGTATIATDRTKRGDHRAYIAAWDDAGASVTALTLEKGLRDRGGEEDVVSRLVIATLARACGVDAASLDLKLAPSETMHTTTTPHGNPIQRLLDGNADWVTVHPDGQMAVDADPPAALLPGSFNPLHDGHIRLAATVHWQATIPDAPDVLHPIPSLFEYDMTENGLRTELAVNPIRAVDGAVPVPDAPGLGIEIDRDVLARYAMGNGF